MIYFLLFYSIKFDDDVDGCWWPIFQCTIKTNSTYSKKRWRIQTCCCRRCNKNQMLEEITELVTLTSGLISKSPNQHLMHKTQS